MTSRESIVREFVEGFEIDVPQSPVDNELQYLTLEMKHKKQYNALMGGQLLVDMPTDPEKQAEELRKIAFYEIKHKLVIDAMISKHKVSVTREELEDEAVALAERQKTTVELVKKFFGDDLAMLERDVKEKKAIDLICEQAR